MKLTTSRLILRPFEGDDWRELHAYLSDPEVVRFEPYDTFTEDQSRAEVRSRAKDDAFVAVCLADTGRVIGNLYLRKRRAGNYELGIVFNRAYWHQAYATEAATAALTYLFDQGEAHRIYAECNPDNRACERLLKRLHMRREGRLRLNESFRCDPASGEPLWQDTLVYAILRDEWNRRPQ